MITVAIPKGGTGKTTTTFNLGVALAEQGLRVLLIDADPGAGLSTQLHYEPQHLDTTLGGALSRYITDYSVDLERSIHMTDDGVDIVPADPRLGQIEDQMRTVFDPQRILGRLVDPLRDSYDIILIDTMPSLVCSSTTRWSPLTKS